MIGVRYGICADILKVGFNLILRPVMTRFACFAKVRNEKGARPEQCFGKVDPLKIRARPCIRILS